MSNKIEASHGYNRIPVLRLRSSLVAVLASIAVLVSSSCAGPEEAADKPSYTTVGAETPPPAPTTPPPAPTTLPPRNCIDSNDFSVTPEDDSSGFPEFIVQRDYPVRLAVIGSSSMRVMDIYGENPASPEAQALFDAAGMIPPEAAQYSAPGDQVAAIAYKSKNFIENLRLTKDGVAIIYPTTNDWFAKGEKPDITNMKTAILNMVHGVLSKNPHAKIIIGEPGGNPDEQNKAYYNLALAAVQEAIGELKKCEIRVFVFENRPSGYEGDGLHMDGKTYGELGELIKRAELSG